MLQKQNYSYLSLGLGLLFNQCRDVAPKKSNENSSTKKQYLSEEIIISHPKEDTFQSKPDRINLMFF